MRVRDKSSSERAHSMIGDSFLREKARGAGGMDRGPVTVPQPLYLGGKITEVEADVANAKHFMRGAQPSS